MLNPPKTCHEQHPWTDEEGYYEKFLCIRDFNECKNDCDQHCITNGTISIIS